jgi:homoserine kinase
MSFTPVAARVPATIANLGPGFDCLGLAVGLWLEARAEPALEDVFVYNNDTSMFDSSNLLHVGWREAFSAAGRVAPKVRLICDNPIPLARGLGSSSAALVGGAALADAAMGSALGRDGVLAVCARLEGHPDNVAPAVLGGLTASAMQQDKPLSVGLELPSAWRVLVAVPAFELETKKARAALPESYSRSNVVFTASRTALWVAAASSGRFELLREACRDVLHQPFRAAFVPGLIETIDAALESGAIAAFLAGAGPSLAAIAEPNSVSSVKKALEGFASDVLELPIAPGFEARVLEVAHGR